MSFGDNERRNFCTDLLCNLKVIYTLITNVYTPSQPLWQNIIAYSLGGLSSFALCAIAMTWEERSKKEEASWGMVYPRVIAVVGCGLDIAIAVVLALLIKQSRSFPHDIGIWLRAYSL